MPKYKDITGERFGRLVALRPIGRDKRKNVIWFCQCDCGNTTTAKTVELKKGSKKSCGCLAKENGKIQLEKNAKRITHGGSSERLYLVYRAIIRRCENKNDKRYFQYGGRGIKMCAEWRNDYNAFREFSIKNGYNPNGKYGETTIDRIDTNGDYSPENCRWVNQEAQQNNKNNNHKMTYNGETLTIAEWAKKLNIAQHTIISRINYGWSVERILTEPVHTKNSRNKCK